MKIIWVNKRNWKHEGPIVSMALRNAHSFTQLGMESNFIVGAGEKSSTPDDLADYYGIKPDRLLAIHRIPRRERGRGRTSSQPVFRYTARLARRLARRSHVVVICRDSGFLPYLARLRRHKRIHGYYELHDQYADLSWREKPRFRDRREQILEHLFLPSIDGLICISEAMRNQYDGLFPRIPKIAVPLGTSPFPAVPPESMRQRRTVCYVGHLKKNKGMQEILALAPLLHAKGIHTLCLGGYPRAVARLRETLESKGLSEAIRIEPFQSPAAMHRMLGTEASIGLSLLKDTFYNQHLTCPVKVLDYLSHGIPVAATDVASNRELLEKTGLLVDPEQPEASARTIAALLGDQAAYAAAVAASRERASELTWVSRAIRLAEFFKKNHGLIPGAVQGRGKVSPIVGTAPPE